MKTREIIYTGNELNSGVRFAVGENNRVTWQEFPVGEIGEAQPNAHPNGTEEFIEQTARFLGYPRRLVPTEGLDLIRRDLGIMHKTGKVPRWARVFKADSF